MASFDRAIPPGGKGKITLTINTKGFQGNIHKSAVVYTNDPKMARFSLGVRAFVYVPISVSPAYVVLRGNADHEISKIVKIVAGLEKPLVLYPDKFNLKEKILYKIKEIEKGRSYLIRFTTIPGNPGIFAGVLNLKTNYEEKPFLNILVRTHLIQGKTNQGK